MTLGESRLKQACPGRLIIPREPHSTYLVGLMVMRPFALFVLATCICLSAVTTHASDQKRDQKIVFSFTDWKPMTFVDKDGTAKGAYVEIAREIFEKRLGAEITFNPLPWKRAQQEVKSGKSDFMVTVPTSAREQYALKGQRPFYTVDMALFAWKGHPKAAQLKKARTAKELARLGITSVTNLGNGWHKQNIQEAGVKTTLAPRDQNIAKMLAEKRADIMIDSRISMKRIIRELGLEQKIEQIHPSFAQIHMNLLLSRKSSWVNRLGEIDDIHAALISDGTTARIIKKYIPD